MSRVSGLKKRYNVVFTVDITLPLFTKEHASQFIKRAVSNYHEVLKSPATWEEVERNERLVQALLKPEHAPVVDQLLQHVAIGAVWNTFGGGEESDPLYDYLIDQAGIPDDFYELLSPVLKTLSSDDQRWFAAAEKNGVFYETISYWYEAIAADIKETFVFAMEPLL